jgi:hypothetical protein
MEMDRLAEITEHNAMQGCDGSRTVQNDSNSTNAATTSDTNSQSGKSESLDHL